MALGKSQTCMGGYLRLIRNVSAKVKITEPEVLRASLSLDLMGDEKRVAPSLLSCGVRGELSTLGQDRALRFNMTSNP